VNWHEPIRAGVLPHLKSGDWLTLALGVLCVALLTLRLWSGELADRAIVRSGGKVFREAPLSRDQRIVVPGPLGESVVVIEKGRARIESDPSPDGPLGRITYGDVYHQNESEQSRYNFEEADVDELFHAFDHAEHEGMRLIDLNLALPAYEQMLVASHAFNLLDARQAISVSERQRFILRIRTLARAIAEAFYASREALGFPMLESAAQEASKQ
jgi:hypothetical protein